jgi:hypothetical protein
MNVYSDFAISAYRLHVTIYLRFRKFTLHSEGNRMKESIKIFSERHAYFLSLFE